MTRALVTGGLGFIGSALVRRLLSEGHEVRLLDDVSRGARDRLRDVASDIEIREGDIRDSDAVRAASLGIDVIWHLAAVNGTENFYNVPDRVLDVGVRGMLNILDAARTCHVPEILISSSSEVYATPQLVPTDESVPLTIPDPLNPRFTYAGSKIITELLALHAGDTFDRAVVFRPHNVYGPDMGWEHVIPQLALRIRGLLGSGPVVKLPIQGDGQQTRSFVHVSDLVEALWVIYRRARHREIYHVGTEEEVTIADLAREIGRCLGCEVEIVAGPAAPGATTRRRPDTRKLRALGFEARVPLRTGLPTTVEWYDIHAPDAPQRAGAGPAA